MEGDIIAGLSAGERPPRWPPDLRNETSVDVSGTFHSSSIEWPGDAEVTPELPHVERSQVYIGSPSPSWSLRLLVQHSPILPRQHKLALLDGYPEIHIGRDIAPAGSDTPRIRLKEMEVSKLHTTIYWDQERAHWAVVDMGSKHGTFIQPESVAAPLSSGSSAANQNGARLSAPRVASMPRRLHHLDRLTIGGTTFIVHLHEDMTPCTSCSPQPEEEIPLFLHRPKEGDVGSSMKRKHDVTATELHANTTPVERNPKRALAVLKRSLLSSQAPASSSSRSRGQQYVDRSARRRSLRRDHSSGATLGDRSSSTTNIGHRLLMKQGWQPGSPLGELSSEKAGLVVPLDPPSTVGRAGIGVPARSSAVGDESWRNAGKMRRWEQIQGEDSTS
ncbi:hypothetical protein C8Q80DRAFT_1162655 [Daedaleopsis nitida]|nr:hypothetical protein C8Q80DRAFT_1162655 [Daedaleopsis nitida]